MPLIYGLIVGIMQPWTNSFISRFYLNALIAIFISAILIISPNLSDLCVAHFGLLLASILPTLFMAHQFKIVNDEKERALELMEQSMCIARTDAMTGLPNRLSLNLALDNLPESGCLTFIDIDGLKYYNDKFGHARGDELLRTFATSLADFLGSKATAYRLGGDEFAITCGQDEIVWLNAMLQLTIENMRTNGFAYVNASSGSAYVYETTDKAKLQHIADCRMYENKRINKGICYANQMPSLSIWERKMTEEIPNILNVPYPSRMGQDAVSHALRV